MKLHVGCAMWTYAPWQGAFYPAGLKQAEELAYAMPGYATTARAELSKLLLEVLPKGLKLTQDAGFGDCGFGYGVSADGTYALVAEKPLKP